MGRLTGSQRPINPHDLSGAEKKTKRKLILEENKRLAQTASQYFKKSKPSESLDANDEASTSTSSTSGIVESVDCEVEETLGELQSESSAQSAECIAFSGAGAQSPEAGPDHQQTEHTDPSTWTIPMTDSTRQLLMSVGPKQVILDSYEEVKGFKFNSRFYNGLKKNGETFKRDWLIYSVKSNSLFCFPCCLLRNRSVATSPWANYGLEKSGFSDFQHTSRGIKCHEQSQLHLDSMSKWKSERRNCNPIDSVNEMLLRKETDHWRSVLGALLGAIIFMARNSLAFRGDSDNIFNNNCGNFLSLAKLLAKYYPPLAMHLERLKHRSVSYLSHDIQNEFINLCGNHVRSCILSQIKDRKYFSIMFDSTPDSSHQEQVSQIIRTVSCSREGCTIEENFIDLISTTEKTGLGLSDVIIKKLDSDGLSLRNCRGQGYDNGSNMSGAYSGVQKHVNDVCPQANYIPCAAHTLNLVGLNAAEKVLPAKLVLGQIQNLYNFFVSSSKRWELLRAKTQTTLKCESKTRWSAKSSAVSALSSQYENIVEVLTSMTTNLELNAETIADSNSRLNELLSFKFLLGLTIWDNVLFKIEICNQALQKKQTDIARASTLLLGLLTWLKEFRLTGFKYCFDKAAEKGKDLGIDTCIGFDNVRSTRGKKKTRLEEKADDSEFSNIKRFEVEFFNALIDTIISEMTKRFEKLKECSDLFDFLWGKGLIL